MRFGFGCVNLGSATASSSWQEQIALVQRSIDGGITHFDTADAYGSGTSERLLGRALRGRRDQVTISTKGGYVFRERSTWEQRGRRLAARTLEAMPRRGPGPDSDTPTSSGSTTGYSSQDFSAAHLRAAVEGSLRRLGVDHIDVHLLHGPREVLPDLFDDLDDLRTSGKVGRFGVGAETLPSAADWGAIPGTEVAQLPFGLLDPEALADVFPSARAHDVELWARGVLGGGVLSAAARDIGTATGHPKEQRIRTVLNIAAEAGIGVDELAIRWVRTFTDVEITLLGMSSQRHVERNIELAAMTPLPDDVAAEVARELNAGLTDNGPAEPGQGENESDEANGVDER